MSNRIAIGEVSQERLDELAMGKLNPKTGKRKGGFIANVRTMRQYADKVAAGEWGEDDLIEQAYKQAWDWLKKQAARASDDDISTADEEDRAYREAAEERYRDAYEWNGTNDEASLQSILALEVLMRSTTREVEKAGVSIKDRVALLGELRNIAKDHAALQKSLGIDRISRDNKSRSEDPMQALRDQIKLGADYVRKLRDEWVEVAPTVLTREELVARAQHHSGLPQDWIEALLQAYERVRAVGGDSTATVVA